MTWLSLFRTYRGQDEKPLEIPDGASDEAKDALMKAKVALAQANERREEIREVADSLARIRERNHFGESIQRAMMPREKRT